MGYGILYYMWDCLSGSGIVMYGILYCMCTMGGVCARSTCMVFFTSSVTGGLNR